MRRRMDNNNKPDEIIDDSEFVASYFSQIPHLVDDIGISVYAYRLYGHIVRRVGAAGAGKCFESVRNMANNCNMSLGTVVKAKKELVTWELIHIKKVFTPNNKYSHDEIYLGNIWDKNRKYCELDRSIREEIMADWREGKKRGE